jgi:hypothetical protein
MTESQRHREELQQLIAAARSRQGIVHFTGYIGGYCNRTGCDVRQVLVRVKHYKESIAEIRCPSCRSLLLLGDHEHGVKVATAEEHWDNLRQRSLNAVWAMLKQKTECGLFTTNLGELRDDVTLADLAQAFRERDTHYMASGTSPGVEQ